MDVRSAWDLPDLIRPLPVRRRPCRKRPKLLPHYPAVVEYIYTSRYASAEQVRRRFPEYLTTQRTAQYQLANLVHLGHLATASVRSTSPNFPYVYYVTSRGVRLVRDAYAALGRDWSGVVTEANRSRGVAIQSLLHEVLLTEFDLAVTQTLARRRDMQRLLTERRYFRRDRRLSYMAAGSNRQLLPDLGFLIRQGSSERISFLLNFVELDNGTMPLTRIAAKYWQYDAWSRSADAEQYLADLARRYGSTTSIVNFRLLMIAHDKSGTIGDHRRLIDLLSVALDLPGKLRDRIWLTTGKALHRVAAARAPLDAEIWWRVRDTRNQLTDYRALSNESSQRWGKSISALQREFIGNWLQSLPKHAIFPRANACVRV